MNPICNCGNPDGREKKKKDETRNRTTTAKINVPCFLHLFRNEKADAVFKTSA